MAKVKAAAVPLPQSREEFEALAERLGGILRRVERMNSEVADQMAALKLGLRQRSAEEIRMINSMWAALSAYAEGHRTELLPPGRKSVSLAAGVLGWRTGTPKVEIEDEDDVIGHLMARGLGQFLREIIEIDKQAMLAEPAIAAEVPGVRITQSESIFFKPLEVEGEKTKTVATVPLAGEAA